MLTSARRDNADATDENAVGEVTHEGGASVCSGTCNVLHFFLALAAGQVGKQVADAGGAWVLVSPLRQG